MCGDVPGEGKGDKIPAKYEPGEFVVSNAMLDAQRVMTRIEERAKAWREIQRYVAETAPALFLYGMSPRYEAVDKAVQGYRFMANASRSYLREAWLKK